MNSTEFEKASNHHVNKLEPNLTSQSFKAFILTQASRHHGLYSKDDGFLLNPHPRYSEESVDSARFWSKVYFSVLHKFVAGIDTSKADLYRDFNPVEVRLLQNAIHNPLHSGIFGAFVGAVISPIALNIITLTLLRFKSPSLFNVAAAGTGAYFGFFSGHVAAMRPTLEPILALPEDSKLRQRVIGIFEEDPLATGSPLYQLYGTPQTSD